MWTYKERNLITVKDAQRRIVEAVTQWEGLSAQPHRFGGTEFVLGTREIGHIHGDYLVDIPFPTKVRKAIVAAGRAEPHHVLPESGWISFYIRAPDDIDRAIALLHESYQFAVQQRSERR